MGVSVKVTVRLTLEPIVVVVVLSVSSVEYKIPKTYYIKMIIFLIKYL